MLTARELSAWRGFLETHARVTRRSNFLSRLEPGEQQALGDVWARLA